MTTPVLQRPLLDMRYAIGTDPNNLSELARMKVPWPDQVIFNPASVYYARGDASRVGDGYMSAQWIWDVISRYHLSMLLEYLGGAEWVKVYIRTDKRDGLEPSAQTSFNVYYGVMLKPIVSGQEGVPIARSPHALQTVAIRFNDLTLQPGYL